MTFEEILDQAIAMLQRRGRITYRAIKVQFQLDDELLETLKEELLFSHPVVDEAGRGLVWTGDKGSESTPTQSPSDIKPYTASNAGSGSEREPLSYTPPHLAEKILQSKSALEGERKQVTVLFCDLQNSTPLAEKIGPENMHTLLNRFFELALSEVHRYEGTINQFLGDGFMAISGAPISHEDHARRAVLAAIGLQRRLKESNPGEPYGVECRFRIGINSGLVVVGSIGDNLRMDYSAIGDTTNLASRLQTQCEPGEILVSEATARLVEGYIRLEALTPVEVKGKTKPVPIYKVMGTLPRRSPIVSRSERTLSQFVGRERELATLEELFAQVKSGNGQVVGIVAEAGQGKSRLLYEFRQCLTDQQVTYLEGRCLSYGSSIPYHPIIDIVQSNCGISEGDNAEAIIEKVNIALREVGMDAEASAPYLLRLLGIQAGTEAISMLTPEAVRTRTFDTLRQMSLQGSQRRPLIFEIEDLHWVDKTSDDYLTSLVESLAGASILLLTTYRPGYQPSWIGKSYATQISLHNLVPQDAMIIVHLAHPDESIPDELAQTIVTKAEGNPFFLEELTRAVIEHGDFQTEVIVPDTIQGVLSARIDRLKETHKRLLQTASVLGREFSSQLLEAIWDGSDSLDGLLSELKQMEFLFERIGAEDTIYVFKHALTQDVAYESLLTTRRQVLHEAAGQALERLFDNRLENAIDRLAYHYSKTGNVAKAVEYLTLMANKAARNSAYVEAANHLTKGLELLKALPDTIERTHKELMLQTILGPVLMAIKGQSALEVEQTYARARQLCQQMGETPQMFPVLWGLWRFYLQGGELQTAQELAEQLYHLTLNHHDQAMQLQAQQALGQTLFFLGECLAARTHLEKGIALYHSQTHHTLALRYGQDPGVVCLGYAGWVLWLLGYPDQAMHKSQEAVVLAQELSHPFSLVFALCFTSALLQFRREGQAVQEYARETVALSIEQGFPLYLALSTILWGWGLFQQGQREQGIDQMKQGLDLSQAVNNILALPHFPTMLAEAHGEERQTEEGLTVLAVSLTTTDKTGVRFYEAELHRLKGELLLQQSPDNTAEAEFCFQQALEVSRRQEAKSLELRTATSLARLWQSQDKRQEAYDLLAPVYGWFTEGFDTADLIDAKALLDELT